MAHDQSSPPKNQNQVLESHTRNLGPSYAHQTWETGTRKIWYQNAWHMSKVRDSGTSSWVENWGRVPWALALIQNCLVY